MTAIRELTAALEAGEKPAIGEITDLLYALQGAVADHDVMLWLDQTPESLADELTKANWLAGGGLRPVSDLRWAA